MRKSSWGFSGSTDETKIGCEDQRGRIGIKTWDTSLRQEVDRSRPESVGSEEGVEVISTMELSCPVCFHWPLDAQGMVVSLPYWWKGRKDTR